MDVPRGLYAITDSGLIGSGLLVDRVGRAIAGGAAMIQYRDKGTDAGRRQWEATDLQLLCRAQRVPLIINDDIELARAVGAAGVHLGQTDAPIDTARTILGPQAIIGVTCHNDLTLAQAAVAAGADYVAFGSFHPSPTKPDAIRADPALLNLARGCLDVPIVAIGGITPDNASALLAAGADLLAVIHGVFAQPDVTAAARAYAELFGTIPDRTDGAC